MNTEEFLKRDVSRRQFLGRSARNAAGVAAGMVSLSSVSASDSHPVVRVGVIGVRNQGRTLAGLLAAMPDVAVTALCDVDRNLEPAATKVVSEIQELPPRFETDFRRLLDDPNIDAIVIATPDHWHAIMAVMACKAGKDVYLEKPVSHTIEEGRRLVAAVAETGRVVQTGLQQRSGAHFQSAVELVRSGRLGEVRLAKAWLAQARKPAARRDDEPAPAGVNFDLWLGPAPERAFNAGRFHHHWHAFRDYGTGELGNWGVHLLDVARWGLGLDLPERVSATGISREDSRDEFPETLSVLFSWPRHTITWEHRLWSNHGLEGRGSGVSFHGERGTLVVDRSGWKVYDSPERLTADASDLLGSHLRNFIDSIRTRRQPVADIQTGHISTMFCHLGNLSWQLNRELRIDPATQSILNDPEAIQLTMKTCRSPWQLPEV